MAEAYATFAARGIHCDPIIVSKITTRDGKNLAVPDANCRRVVDKDVADGVNKVLKSVVDKGTGKRAKIYRRSRHRRQDRDDQQQRGRLVCRLHAGDRRRGHDLVDNTKRPFIKRGPGYYRRSGVKGYRVPSTGVYLEGSGQRRRRHEDLEAGHAEVLPADPEDRVQPAAAQDPGRQAGAGAQSVRAGHCRRDQEAGDGRLHG